MSVVQLQVFDATLVHGLQHTGGIRRQKFQEHLAGNRKIERRAVRRVNYRVLDRHVLQWDKWPCREGVRIFAVQMVSGCIKVSSKLKMSTGHACPISQKNTQKTVSCNTLLPFTGGLSFSYMAGKTVDKQAACHLTSKKFILECALLVRLCF